MTEEKMKEHLWQLCELEECELDLHRYNAKVTVETLYDDRLIRLTISPIAMAIFLGDYELVKKLCEKDFLVSFMEEGNIYLDVDLNQDEDLEEVDTGYWYRGQEKSPITLGNILLMHAYEMPVECLHMLNTTANKQAVKAGPAISFGKDYFDNPLFRMQNDVAASKSLYVLYKQCPDLIKDMMLVDSLGVISYPVGAGDFEKKNYKRIRNTLYEILKDADKELMFMPKIFLTPNVEFYKEFFFTKQKIKNCMEDAAYCIKLLMAEGNYYEKSVELSCAYCLGLFMAIAGLIDFYQDESNELSLRKRAFEITMPVVEFIQNQYKTKEEIFDLLFGILNLSFNEYGFNEKNEDGTTRIDVGQIDRMLWIFHYVFRLPIQFDLADERTIKLIEIIQASDTRFLVDFLEYIDCFTDSRTDKTMEEIEIVINNNHNSKVVEIMDYILHLNNEELLYLALKKGLIPLTLVEACIRRYHKQSTNGKRENKTRMQTSTMASNGTDLSGYNLLPILLAYRAKKNKTST